MSAKVNFIAELTNHWSIKTRTETTVTAFIWLIFRRTG
jgi:hypothetical protein